MKPQNLPIWKRELPNMITWARIAAIPAVIYFLQVDDYRNGAWATLFFTVASISDFFDGYFARYYNVASRLGTLLDPVADKLLVTAALIMLLPLGRISPILVILLLSRDLMINGLRAVAAAEQMIIGASWTAKWKTTAQMVGIPCLMLQEIFGIPLVILGQVLLWGSLILSVVSAIDYLRAFIHRPKQT